MPPEAGAWTGALTEPLTEPLTGALIEALTEALTEVEERSFAGHSRDIAPCEPANRPDAQPVLRSGREFATPCATYLQDLVDEP